MSSTAAGWLALEGRRPGAARPAMRKCSAATRPTCCTRARALMNGRSLRPAD